MRNLKYVLIITMAMVWSSCQSHNDKKETTLRAKNEIVQPTIQDLGEYETAYFASGCFWCVEAIFESVIGVKEVVSGYAGGAEENPTYEQVGGGYTSHAEAVKIYYDPKIISFTALVQVFFGSHDPTTLNRQGPDRGSQYRSVAFYKNEKQKNIIQGYINALKEQNVYEGGSISTEVTEFTVFYDAEDYHQDYERKHPDNSYIVNISVPRLNRFKKNFREYLKDETH